MTIAEMQAELERVQAENAEYKAKAQAIRDKAANRPLTFKVSEKGGVSVYGLGRFPVTLYDEQWERLCKSMEDLTNFRAEHSAELTRKAS